MNTFNSILAAGFTSDVTSWQTIARFFAALLDNRIEATDCVVWAAILLGVTCGLLGCFIVLRRQSLLGDAIGHAVLPGVCLGFLAAGMRSMPALLLGALIAGLVAAALIAILQRTTSLKSGECMGVVFTGFYGLGIVLLRYIQQNQQLGADKAGLDKFLFGQIVGTSLTDVKYMAVIAMIAIATVIIFWRKLAVSSFDEDFAFSLGLPVRATHYLLTALLTVAIVISIQAVGVVLVAAMLITPAATAYLLTDRLHRMAILSAIFGAAAGVLGAFLSLLGNNLPTGAFMVLGASTLFAAAFLFSPIHGLLPRLVRLYQQRQKTQSENLLRTLYLMMEKRGNFEDRRFGVHDVAAQRQETPAHVRRLARLAARRGWIDPGSDDPIILTDQGLIEAKRVVRNHRLWELFLTQEAKLGADHVHADAEYIEHVLPRDVLARLERMLESPTTDPHGRPIPAR
ncbi:MAG TPA: iron chelate uptake ABC transporter family permease subunit [Tepidisphaeraceae bacterium]|nr:iron chelate uptake ABC transporter family permease subunit [Tepidisphaeraceae bacterium]